LIRNTRGVIVFERLELFAIGYELAKQPIRFVIANHEEPTTVRYEFAAVITGNEPPVATFGER
jgi:hypothetical protein